MKCQITHFLTGGAEIVCERERERIIQVNSVGLQCLNTGFPTSRACVLFLVHIQNHCMAYIVCSSDPLYRQSVEPVCYAI